LKARGGYARIGWGENRAAQCIEIKGAGMRITIEDLGAPSSRMGELISRALEAGPEVFETSEGAAAPATASTPRDLEAATPERLKS